MTVILNMNSYEEKMPEIKGKLVLSNYNRENTDDMNGIMKPYEALLFEE